MATSNEIDVWGLNIKQFIDNAIIATTPMKRCSSKAWIPPWALEKKKYITIYNQAKKAYRKWKQTPTHATRILYDQCLRNCFEMHRKMLSDSINLLSSNATRDPKSFFRMLSSCKNSSSNIPQKMSFGHGNCNSIKEITDAFTTFFKSNMNKEQVNTTISNIYNLYAINFDDQYSYIWENYIHQVSAEEISVAIHELQVDKNPGTSILTSSIVKNNCEIFSVILHNIISTIYENNTVPSCWKSAIILPIPKKWDKNEITNYRGIAIQSLFAKIIDKTLTSKLYRTYSNIIPDFQHGFVKRRGTVSNLVEMTSMVIDGMVEGDIVGAIYFDIEKAFDKLDHHILLTKLARLSTPFNVFQLIYILVPVK